ncbi:hypothetical protein [Rickettsiella endosymbiont of Miltochrista miniata]|uniref:hypothetical protein n=1 Tax=Rickettsiella endosymbiont of Miltochrista miniata TaxID=3066239 RepID=UPI00313ABB64
MNDTSEFGLENLINVSTQNNFCGYYVLARRIINDANFAVILDKFNQFYQTNWYPDQLAEVVENMHPQQADIMLGLVIHHQHSPSLGKGRGLFEDELELLCEAFGYNPSIISAGFEGLRDSVMNELQDQSDSRKILILFDRPKGNATIGHYYLIEPDATKVTDYKEKCSPDVDHAYEINNCGGIDFVENIKKSVAKIKPNWTLELKNQQIQEDEIFAWKLAAEEARRAGLTFFTSERTISNEEKTRLEQLQSARWLIFQT